MGGCGTIERYKGSRNETHRWTLEPGGGERCICTKGAEEDDDEVASVGGGEEEEEAAGGGTKRKCGAALIA